LVILILFFFKKNLKKKSKKKKGFEGTGMGRIVTFKQSISFEELVQRTKKLLNLSHGENF